MGKVGAMLNDTTLRAFVGYSVRRASMLIQADLKKTLAPFDLRMITFSALAIVHDNPGLTQSALAGALSVERANLVQIVDELEQRNLIARQRNPEDRRSNALILTADGMALFQRVKKAVTVHDARMTQGLGLQNRESLREDLQKIGKV